MVLVDVGLGEPIFGAADLGGVDARSELLRFIGPLTRSKRINEALHVKGSVFSKLLQLATEFVFQDAAGDAQLLEVGEVAKQGHVGIGWVIRTHGLVVVPALLSCSHQAQVGAQQYTLEVSARRGETDVETGLVWILNRAREEVVITLRAWRRKDAHLAAGK